MAKDKVEDDAGLAGEGHNANAEHDLIREHAKKIIDANAAVAAANKMRSKLRKEAKADGITLGTLDKMVALLEMTPDEQRAFFHEHHTYADALHIAHVPVGSQLDLMEHSADPEVQKIDWYNRGWAAATTGKGVFGEPPDTCPPEHVQDWLGGWGAGQAANAPAEFEDA